jgi:hypothetical protein
LVINEIPTKEQDLTVKIKDFNQKTEPWQGYNYEPSKTSLESHPSIKANK